jgi:hypothetical protein
VRLLELTAQDLSITWRAIDVELAVAEGAKGDVVGCLIVELVAQVEVADGCNVEFGGFEIVKMGWVDRDAGLGGLDGFVEDIWVAGISGADGMSGRGDRSGLTFGNMHCAEGWKWRSEVMDKELKLSRWRCVCVLEGSGGRSEKRTAIYRRHAWDRDEWAEQTDNIDPIA